MKPKSYAVLIRKNFDDVYYERRMKFPSDDYFIASALGFSLGVGTMFEFPLSN